MEMDVLAELIECSVCLDRMDDKSKVLPCQHTFCKDCLLKISSSSKQNELRCPECRAICHQSVKNLPANFLLVRLLEGLKAAGKPIPTKQEISVAIGKPCAKAMYAYEPQESGDLPFRRGELIYLKKKLDENWYIGELNGKSGYLPATYVQVICPLPSKPPTTQRTEASSEPDSDAPSSTVSNSAAARCPSLVKVVALYDFIMRGESDKEDCLRFRKDDSIQVIRRVDENWAEGRIGHQIGIFPMSYVTITEQARQLFDAPAYKPLSRAKHKARPHSDQVLSSRSKSPTDAQPGIFVSKRGQVVQKGVTRANIPSSSHLTRDDIQEMTAVNQSQSVSGQTVGDTTASIRQHSLSAESLSSNNEANTPVAPVPSTSRHAAPTVAPVPSTSRHAAPTANQPALYRALFNYRPQKHDELALIRGAMYHVMDKCKDGWYRGKCSLTGAHGVFPGNYVQSEPVITSISNIEEIMDRAAPETRARLEPPRSRHQSEKVSQPEVSPPITDKQRKYWAQEALRLNGMEGRRGRSSAKSSRDKNTRRSASLSRLETHSVKAPVVATKKADAKVGKFPAETRFRCVTAYPAEREGELTLNVGDVVLVLKKKSDGWFKGTNETTNHSGTFPACFVQSLPTENH